MSAGIIIGSTQISARLLPHVRAAHAPGRPALLLAAGGMYSLTFIDVHSGYADHILPGTLLLGLGLGLTFMPVDLHGHHRRRPAGLGRHLRDLNTAQQVGGSIGTALLNTIAATSTATYVAQPPRRRPRARAADTSPRPRGTRS